MRNGQTWNEATNQPANLHFSLPARTGQITQPKLEFQQHGRIGWIIMSHETFDGRTQLELMGEPADMAYLAESILLHLLETKPSEFHNVVSTVQMAARLLPREEANHVPSSQH